jgi:subtilase family serine protease
MFQKCWFVLPCLLTASLVVHSAANAQVGLQARSVLTQAIDESRSLILGGNTRPEVNSANDRGPVADDMPLDHLFLQLRRSPDQEHALGQFIEQLHDPNSPNFHKWLTAKEFGERFGVAKQDLDMVTSWLKSRGFAVNGVYPNLAIDFSGTARQIREAFHTEIHHVLVNGEAHYTNINDPQIPAALAPAVVGVASLHNFMPQRLNRAVKRPAAEYTINAGSHAVVPQDLATTYNLNTVFAAGYSGQGQTIVALEDSNVYSTGDWLVFRKVFGLARPYPQGKLVELHPQAAFGNNCLDPGLNASDAEAILDAEWASAAAPDATIELASCADTSIFGGFIALQNLLSNSDPPGIISIGYGESEVMLGATNNAYIRGLYQMAVVEGVSVFVASGDGGPNATDPPSDPSFTRSGIGVSGYASTPYNVSVGGTDFADTYFGTTAIYWDSKNSPTFGSALSYIPEIPWNDSCASVLFATQNGFSTSYGKNGYCNNGGSLSTFAAGGGRSGCATGLSTLLGVVSGSCAGYPKPSWQSIFGNPQDGVRDVPDVSLFASNGTWGHYSVVCYSDPFQGGNSCLGPPSTWAGFGGTSVSSPVMAGIQALINQKTRTRWGNPNAVYYRLASIEYGDVGNSSCNSDGSSLQGGCTFHDITLGDTNVHCSIFSFNCYLGLNPGFYGVISTSDTLYEPAYKAKAGWDFATGIGSVDAWNLLQNWSTGVGAVSAGLARD